MTHPDTPMLPYGITNSFKDGAIIYLCPYCDAAISDNGDPRSSTRARTEMIRHVRFMHGDTQPPRRDF